MDKRALGHLEVSAIGLGCMGMSQSYGPFEDEESLAALDRAFEVGMTFLDTSDMYGYGNGHNEDLIGKALAGRRRGDVVLATKFGIRGWTPDRSFVLNSTPEYAKRACEASLRRLGTDYIDLYYLHRRDRSVPIEETIGGMAELVKQGKVRGIGLSEVNAETLRRAHAAHPITALESEYSLLNGMSRTTCCPPARNSGSGSSPSRRLAAGFLTGEITDMSKLSDDDYRRTDPRFLGDNLTKNLLLLERVKEFALDLDATPAQVALAWLLARHQSIVPIPGTKRARYVSENAVAADIRLTGEQVRLLDAAMPSDAVSGDRYPEGIMRTVNA